MKYAVPPFRFDITLQAPRSFPRSMGRALFASVKAALAGLPKGVLRGTAGVTSRPAALHLAILGTRAMHAMNLHYRKKDRPTDVLSFPFPKGIAYLSEIGDIAICWPVIRRQAREHGVSEKEELQRMAVHGVLHLFGYDHERGSKDARVMFGLQERIVKGLSTERKRVASSASPPRNDGPAVIRGLPRRDRGRPLSSKGRGSRDRSSRSRPRR